MLMQALLRVFRGLAGDRFFLILLAALLVLAGASPTPIWQGGPRRPDSLVHCSPAAACAWHAA